MKRIFLALLLVSFAAATFEPSLYLVDFKFVNDYVGDFDFTKSAHLQFFAQQLMKHLFTSNGNFGLPLIPSIQHVKKHKNAFQLITVGSDALLDIVRSTKREPIVVESLASNRPAKLIATKLQEFHLIAWKRLDTIHA